jgi:hypothetical protein
MKAGLALGFVFCLFFFGSRAEVQADHYYYHTLHEVHYQNRYPYQPQPAIVYTCRPVLVHSPARGFFLHGRPGSHRPDLSFTHISRACSAIVLEPAASDLLR